MHIRQVYRHYDPEKTRPPAAYQYCPFCSTSLLAGESDGTVRPTCPACGFTHYQNPSPTVSILITDGERVLLGKRSGDPGKGTWAIPSGYVEYEDDYLATAIREAREETGLEVEIYAILNVVSSFIAPRFHFLGIYVVAGVVSGTLAAGDDLDVVQWFPLSGPLPEMGFQEDRDMIELVVSGVVKGLPVDIEHAAQKAGG